MTTNELSNVHSQMPRGPKKQVNVDVQELPNIEIKKSHLKFCSKEICIIGAIVTCACVIGVVVAISLWAGITLQTTTSKESMRIG
ncbi:unnamed protein product [Adineta steineri]|uniref:Uncharacterized protein n=1 Tax=Adineta steineri TaxID=433720 RepID=A0A813XSZ1_9BILA|nr:unnamed protein product [Adineta steineri]CAF0901203.1 unnamed protein product [Adineta steineri]